MSKALEGVRILDFTHVQSGPDLHAAAGLVRRRRDQGRARRRRRRHARRSCATSPAWTASTSRCSTTTSARSRWTPRSPKGKQVLDTLIKTCDVLVENFAPGALDRMGITWEHIQELNPRMIVASVKGFGPGTYEDCKVYENVAQCAGGVGIDHRLRRRPADGHRRADRRQRHRPAPGAGHRRRALPAQQHRARPEGAGADAGRGAQPVPRQAARPAAAGAHRHACTSTRSTPTASSAMRCRAPATPRAAASRARSCAARAGRPTRMPTSTSSRRRAVWPAVCKVIGEEGWIDDEAYATPAGAPAAPEADLRAHREVDHDQGQVRGHGDPQPVRHSLRADPVDEGDRRRTRRCARPAPSSRSTTRRAAST